MSIKRYGVEGGKGTGGQHLPFARAVEADGWLYVSGQVPMVNGELVAGNITVQSRQAISNVVAILKEAGYGRRTWCGAVCGCDDPRDFCAFNAVFKEFFGEHPPARSCVHRTWWWIARWSWIALPTRLRRTDTAMNYSRGCRSDLLNWRKFTKEIEASTKSIRIVASDIM